MPDLLSQRKRWFAFFPEGTLEFLVVTRVLALALLGALIIVPSSQRPAVLLALAAMVWADYALAMWWLVQTVSDLEYALAPGIVPNDEASDAGGPTYGGASIAYSRRSGPTPPRLAQAYMVILLPSIFATLAVSPWSQFVLSRALARSHLAAFLLPALVAACLASLPFAYKTLGMVGLKGPWPLLLLIPVVHWFALHRLLKPLHARVRDRALQQNLPVSAETGAGGAAAAADVLLIVGALFWTLWAVLLANGRTSGATLAMVQIASVGTGCLFAVTEVAALEYLQRRLVALIRRAGSSPAVSSGRE